MIMTLQYIDPEKRQNHSPTKKINIRATCWSQIFVSLAQSPAHSLCPYISFIPEWSKKTISTNPKVWPKKRFFTHWSGWRCEKSWERLQPKTTYCPSPSRISSRFQVVYQENIYMCLLVFFRKTWMISKNKWMHIATNYLDACPLSQYPSLRTINFTSRRIPLSDGQEIH